MRAVLLGLLTLLAASAVWGQEAGPTEAAIKQLFEVMHTSKLFDDVMAQVDQMMHASIRDSLQGQTFNAEQQQIVDDMGTFYRSATGQAVIAKMPATVKQMMQLTQQRMGNLQPKIAQLQSDTMAALKRAQSRAADKQDQSGSPASPSAPPPAPR
jgi:hypothetical protein